jgi:hypothetical protein
VHLIFEAELDEDSRTATPHVTEVGGSTDHVEWVPIEAAHDLDLLSAARHALDLLD